MTAAKTLCAEQSYAGYQRHRKNKELACSACRAAATAYHRALRIKEGQTRHVMVSTDVLGIIADLHPALYELLEHEIGNDAMKAIQERGR